MGQYLSYVSDDDFLECVERLVDAYIFMDDEVNIDRELMHAKNTTDFIKVLFDVYTQHISLKKWAESEVRRRNDKTINNKIGEFHQELLGKVDGWINLGVGDESGVDLKKEDNSIFIELKNKHNTLNASSQLAMRNKLESIQEKYPDSTCYWAYVIEKNYNSRNEIWEYNEKIKNSKNHIKHYNPNIKVISGVELYTLVTGDSTALKQLLDVLPDVINFILMDKYNETFTELSVNDKKTMEKYLRYVLDN